MKKIGIGCLSALLLLAACSKETERLSAPALSEYFPLQVGKYVVYRMDSIALLNFGTGFTTRSYRVRDVVDAEITDNQGRKSYRIYRSITDTNGVAPYRPLATYVATPQGSDWIEYVDDNMRFMKLRWPITPTLQWKGNSFFASPNSFWDDWTYQYDSIGLPYTVLGKTYDSTVKVMQRDYATSPGEPVPTVYQQKDFSEERYAKGIGLIYKYFLHYVWQPTASTPAHYEDGSYGIRLRIIDHN